MSGEIYKEDGECEDFVFETRELGEDEEDEDPLGDLKVLVKKLPEWMSGSTLGRGDMGTSEVIEGEARKRRNEKNCEEIPPRRMKMRRLDTTRESSEQSSSNCIFCERRTRNQSGDRGGIPRAEINPCASILLTFNQIWPYLQNNCQDAENMINLIETNFTKTVPLSLFPSLPTMCVFCGGELEKIDARLKSLWMGIKNLSSVIQKSRVSRDSHLSSGSMKPSQSISHQSTLIHADSRLYPIPALPPDYPMNESEAISEASPIASPMSEMNAELDSENENDMDPYYIKSEQEDISSSSASEAEVSDNKPITSPQPQFKNTKISIQKPRATRTQNAEPGNSSKINDKEDTLYLCFFDNCGQTFPTRKGAKKHQQNFHKIKKNFKIRFFCSICGNNYSAFQNLTKHKLSAHGTNNSSEFKCDLCRDSVPEEDLYAHITGHVGEDYAIKCTNPKCNFAFAKPASLYLHLNVNKTCLAATTTDAKPKRRSENCQICDYAASTAKDLGSHLTKNHEKSTKNYSCPISGCQQKFTVKQSVVLHLPYHDFSHCLTYQTCVLCSEQTKVDKMKEHLEDKHQVPEIIKCKQCSFLFSTREQLLEHMYNHRYGQLLCGICEDGVKYSRHADLRDHYLTEHKIGKKILCEECGGQYWTREELLTHCRRKHKSSNIAPKIFKCEECMVEYKTEISLESHNIRVHGAEPLRCTICAEIFFNRVPFTKHIREHKGVKAGNEIKCNVEGCGKTFNTTASLYRHKRVYHLGVRHVCDICGKSYTGMEGLKTHKNSVHLGLRPCVCDECGESFVSSSVLKTHKLVHTGDRPFPCKICGQRFRYSGVLKTHLEGHERKGSEFKPNGPMKQVRKRVDRKN